MRAAAQGEEADEKGGGEVRTDLWNILEPVHVDPARKSWKDVLRNLVFHANLEGCAWPGVATIRAETGYKSDKAVVDALAGLRELGIIAPVPVPETATGGGRGRPPTKWCINNLANTVDKLVDKLKTSSAKPNRDTLELGEPTSGKAAKPNRDTPELSEPTSELSDVTSELGEVTSARNNKEYKSELSTVGSMRQKGEVTSPNSDNHPNAGGDASAEGSPAPHGSGPKQVAPSARNEGRREPRRMDVRELFPGAKPDYVAMCAKLGWRPNDPTQTPPEDAELARRAVVACAYREGLSPDQAKKFLRYNAKMKWKAIDQASCVKDLAKEFCEAWKRKDIDAFGAEVERRRSAARRRAAARGVCP